MCVCVFVLVRVYVTLCAITQEVKVEERALESSSVIQIYFKIDSIL